MGESLIIGIDLASALSSAFGLDEAGNYVVRRGADVTAALLFRVSRIQLTSEDGSGEGHGPAFVPLARVSG